MFGAFCVCIPPRLSYQSRMLFLTFVLLISLAMGCLYRFAFTMDCLRLFVPD